MFIGSTKPLWIKHYAAIVTVANIQSAVAVKLSHIKYLARVHDVAGGVGADKPRWVRGGNQGEPLRKEREGFKSGHLSGGGLYMVRHGQVGGDAGVGGLPPLVGGVELLVALGGGPGGVPGPQVRGGAAQGDHHLGGSIIPPG